MRLLRQYLQAQCRERLPTCEIGIKVEEVDAFRVSHCDSLIIFLEYTTGSYGVTYVYGFNRSGEVEIQALPGGDVAL